LGQAAQALKPGGRLVYCTCSLEREEGPDQFAAFLAAHPEFTRIAIDATAVGGEADWLTQLGEIRTLPHFLSSFETGLRGMDGFYIAIAGKSV